MFMCVCVRQKSRKKRIKTVSRLNYLTKRWNTIWLKRPKAPRLFVIEFLKIWDNTFSFGMVWLYIVVILKVRCAPLFGKFLTSFFLWAPNKVVLRLLFFFCFYLTLTLQIELNNISNNNNSKSERISPRHSYVDYIWRRTDK